MTRLSGGWQVLLPHAGKERTVDGAVRGFHGEAGLTAWTVESASTHTATFSVSLLSAPLSVWRRITVAGLSVIVEEVVTNESPDPCAFSWGHHPTFGAPLVAPGTRIEIPAKTQVDEGTALSRRWPVADGDDRSVVPVQPRALLTYLESLDDGVYRILNDQLGLGVELRWPIQTFPNVWLWQELKASRGFPWFRRAYAMGVEPHTTAPQGGSTGVELASAERRSVRLELRVLHDPFPAPLDRQRRSTGGAL